MDLNSLPQDCLSTIFSFTSPEVACTISSVSTAFRSYADSDLVWDQFLPSDYKDILARSYTPMKFSSKKELFFMLCNSILLDGGKVSFSLDKSRGQKSYTLSARELSILSGNESNHWNWKSIPESRFSEVAELKTISRLRIEGRIRTKMLSSNTTYGAYLVVKISNFAFGLDSLPSEISVKIDNDHVQSNTAYLRSSKDQVKQQFLQGLFYGNRAQLLKQRVDEGDERLPIERKDGWMEIEIGELFSDEVDKEVKICLMEVKGHQLKGGLIIEGIEIRPKH